MKLLLVLAAAFLGGCGVLSSKEGTVGCQAADVVTTKLAIMGGAHEANPIALHILNGFGWGGFFFWKAALTVALLQVREKSPAVVGTANAATCFAAASNLRFIR